MNLILSTYYVNNDVLVIYAHKLGFCRGAAEPGMSVYCEGGFLYARLEKIYSTGTEYLIYIPLLVSIKILSMDYFDNPSSYTVRLCPPRFRTRSDGLVKALYEPTHLAGVGPAAEQADLQHARPRRLRDWTQPELRGIVPSVELHG